ncbi:MAG: TolC family protein [Myxococcota bacterium]
MHPRSLALIAVSLSFTTPAFAEPLRLFAIQTVAPKGSGQPIANPNADAFNSKVEALFTPGTGLTADEAAAKATKTSYDALAQREEMLSAEALRQQAKHGFIPTLALTANYTRTRTITNRLVQTDPITGTEQALVLPFFPNQYSLGANLSIPLSDYFLRLPQNLAAANRGLDAASLTSRHTELSTATGAKVAYYEWARAKLQHVVREQALEQAKAQAKDVKAQFDAGSSTNADVLRLESNVATAELNLERAKNAAQLAEERLRTQMHDASQGNYQIGEDVRVDLPQIDNVGDITTLWQEAEQKRLDLKALSMQAQAQRERASATRADYYPRLTAQGTAQYLSPLQQRFPQTDEWDYWWTVGATLSWTPTAIFGARQGAESLEHQASKIEAQRNYARDNVHVSVLDAYQALNVAAVAIDTTTRSLASAEESYRVRRALFQNGRATTVEVIDTETALTNARSEAMNARIDLRIARARLINAIGRDTDQRM